MDAVGVGTQSRGPDGEVLDVYPFAAVELDMELRAVLDAQASHGQIVAHEEPD